MNKLAAQVDASQKIVALYTQNLDELTAGGQAATELLASCGTDEWETLADEHLTKTFHAICRADWIADEALSRAGRAFNDAHTAFHAARFAN